MKNTAGENSTLTRESKLWGITGEVTARLLAEVFDWTPPAKPREVEGTRDLLP